MLSGGALFGSFANMANNPGYFTQTFGEFEKVNSVIAESDTGGFISGYLVAIKPVIVSGNTVAVLGMKAAIGASGNQVTGGSGYIAMVSGDLISNTVTIFAYGE
jgi:hypothetical protein